MSSKTTKRFTKASVSAALVASSLTTIVAPSFASTHFNDLDSNNIHYNDILNLSERGIISGFPDGTYRPNVAITRGQAAKIIAKTLDLDTSSIENPNFSDVNDKDEFYPYIAALVKAGIISGYSDKTFKPKQTITRGQMSKMIAIGFNLEDEIEAPFTDVPANHPFANYINALFSSGVTTGKTATTFDLNGEVTRGQLASFVARAENTGNDSETTATAIIEDIKDSSVTIDGEKYKVNDSVSFLLNSENKSTLLNADVTFTAKNNEILSISYLSVKNGASFDGQNANIDEIKFASSITSIKNVLSQTIQYDVNGTVNIENVTANKLIANADLNAVASVTKTLSPMNLTINGSHFEVVQLIGAIASLQKTASTISTLYAENVTKLQINGDYKNVILPALAKVSGNAIIEKLDFSNGNIQSFNPSSTIQINNIVVNGNTMTWTEAVKQYLQPETSNNSNNNVSVIPTPAIPEEESGNTDKPVIPDGDDNTDKPITPGDNGNNDKPITPGDSGNTDKPVTPGDSGTDLINAQNINVVDDTLEIIDPATNITNTYTVANNIKEFFYTYKDVLANVQLAISNEEITAIENVEINAQDTFDGTRLNSLDVNEITINGANTIRNLTNVDNVAVTTTADTLIFDNVSANIYATGTFNTISGASGDSLTIESSSTQVLIENTTSSNITINETPFVAHQLNGKKIASLNSFRIAASTNMQITFSEGDYAGKTLNINRKDTTINVKGTPFSEIKINSNNVDLLTSGQEVNRLTVSNNVSNLAIDANISNFVVTLDQPLTIHSSSAKTISSLDITTNATATGLIDLINVTVSTAKLNGNSISESPVTNNPIFKQAANVSNTSIPEFSSALERTSFGKYKINIAGAGTYYYVDLKNSDLVENFKKLTTLSAIETATTASNGLANNKSYTVGNSFIFYADVTDIVIYKMNGLTVEGVSVVSAPSNAVSARLYDFNKDGTITFHTRFSNAQTPSSALNTVYIFKNGSLAKETAVSGSWTGLNELNTISVKTGVELTGTREVILANNVLGVIEALPETYPNDYVNIFKAVAKKAAEKNNPMLMQPLLNFVFAQTTGTYDSSFLTKYIAAINEKANILTSLTDFNTLIDNVDAANEYDPSVSLKASDLYLTGNISSNFTYSTNGVITNTINDANELLFNAVSQGTTTLRVTDSNGLATLVNVTVGADNKITTEILATDATQGTFVEGASNFRYSTDNSKLIATTLTKSSAIIKAADSTLKRVTLTPNGTAFALSTEQTLTTEKVSPTVFGLNNITSISGDNIGFYKEDDQFVLYARYEGTELALVTDGTNTTALNANTTNTITNFANSIAKTESKALNSDLNLLSLNSEIFAPSNTKNVFLYNDGSQITAFANDAFKGSIKLTDSANNISIINVEATKNANAVTMKPIEVVKTSLAESKDENDNPILINQGASVQKIDTPVVRADGLELYAIATGTTNVTLTNGKQYKVTVTANGGTYSITKEEVKNLVIKASDLHMKDITSVIGTNAYDSVNENSEVIITLPNTTGTVLTLLSSNNEKTIINVTRDDINGYDYTVYRSELEATAAGLDKITAVYNVGTPPLLMGARVKAADDKLYVYNLDAKQHAFRVSNGTLSTLVNIEITPDGNGFKSQPQAVTHNMAGYTIDPTKEIVGTGARLKDGILYATGEGFNVLSTANVQVPLNGGSYYVININYNADTGLYNFDSEGTVTFKESFTKEQLGLATITNALTDASHMTATTANDIVTVAITKDTEGRIEVIGTDAQGQQAKSFIYIKRDASNVTKSIERAEVAANTTLDLDLTNYGYTATPTGSWSVTGIARTTISSALKLNLYAQDAGKSLLTLTDGNGKNLLINVAVSADNPHATSVNVVEKSVADDTTVTGTIVSADGIRLSSDGKKVYATDENGKATLKLTDGADNIKFVAYTVSKNADGEYEIKSTELTNASVTLAGAKLLPNESTNVVLQQGNEFVAIGEGTVHVLHENVIKEIVVTKQDEHFKIDAPVKVSDVVISADDLGLSATSALTIETATDSNFYVGQLDGKIVAYSKLTGTTTGSYEFVVKAQETEDRAVVRLTDAGTTALTHAIAKESNITFNGATAVTVKNSDIARFDKANNTLYLLKEGSTYATADGRLFAVDVIRKDNQLSLLPLEDGTTIDVKPLQITDATDTFSKIVDTDESIIELDGKTIHAKALGTTKVKLGNRILTVTIAKDEDGQYRMTKSETSSTQISFEAAGLDNFKSAEVKAGVADAVSLSIGTDGLTIFSNGAKTAQSLLVHVIDNAGNKAAINVTLDATGAVIAAEVVKNTVENLAVNVAPVETVQTAGARGVWNDTTLTVYPLAATNTALKFTNALVNIATTADGNLVNTPTITPLTHGLTSIESSTNAALVNDTYLTDIGNGLVYADSKIYSVDVKEENGQYVKTISAGVPAVTFDLTTIGGTYAEDQSTLTAAKVIDYPNDGNKLIVYANGTGTSEIAITSSNETTIYQTKATANTIDALTPATAVLDSTMNGATVEAGDALRIKDNKMFYLKEGNTVLKANNKLINTTVSRNANGYFIAAPTYVTKELKETATLDITSKFIAEDKKLFVKEAATETFYTANYRVTATATEANNIYSLSVDERHMVKFDVSDYFTQGTVTANASPSTHAFGEVVGDELIIYAGTTTGQSTVTFTNGTNNVTFNVTHDAAGKVTATAQTVVNTLPYADLNLVDGTDIEIAPNSFNNSIVELVKTDDGIAIYPKDNGITSFALTDGTNTVRLVNVKVETVAGAFKITPTPVTFTAPGTSLFATLKADQVGSTDKYYATALGTALYGTADPNNVTTATFVSVTKNEDNGYFSVQTTEHNLATITAASLGLSEFKNISLVGSSVDTKLSADNKTLYIYGTNNGYTDVLVDDGTNFATVVTSHQNTTLKATPAKKALTELKDANWNTSLVGIRDENMYASYAGKDVATATISNGTDSYKALMNIIVTRKSNQEFEIDNKVIRENVGNATVISGSSIIADGEYIYAQHAGSSVIKVGNEFKTVEVTQSADGLYTLTVGAGFTSNVVTAAEVGLSTIDNYKLSAITGNDVVEVQLIDGSAHLFAKKAGEVHLVLSEGTDPNKVQTSVHVLVEEQSGILSLTPTPSKLEFNADPVFKTTNNLFRLSSDNKTIYAIKDGSIFATIDSELHKLTVSNNLLNTTKTRIEAELPGVVTISANDSILKADATNNKLVVAKDFGTTNVTVDSDEYQVTVKQDGSIEYKKLSTDVINVSEIFTTTNVTTVKIGNDSILGTPAELNNAFIIAASLEDNKVTLTPVKEGTATVLISDGTNTIQAQVTVGNENGLKVSHVVPVSKYYTSTVGFYPTAIKQPNGSVFTSANGLVTLKDGEITVYPGEKGPAQLIIEGNDGQKGLFELTVSEDDYKFTHFVQTIGYDKFASNATILATQGSAKATPGVTGIDVIYEDLNKDTFFVVKATNQYKIVKVKATVSGNSFEAAEPVISDALVVAGEVTNINGLHTVEDDGNTIIYADANTTFPASYTLNGIIYKVSTGTAPNQLVSTPLTLSAPNVTDAIHMQGDDVITLGNNSWKAKSKGTGIYKITENGTTKYVSIEVTKTSNSYEIKTPVELQHSTLSNTLKNVQVIAPASNVYVDTASNIIYGKTTEKVVISAEEADKKVLYSGTLGNNDFEVVKSKPEELLEKLEWNAFTQSSLNEASPIVRISGNEIYGLSVGEELITFESPNGLERTMKVIVNADYTITITAETPHILTYSTSTPVIGLEEINFTFTLNVPENVSGLIVTPPTNNPDASVSGGNKLKVFITPGTPVTSTFTIVLPELVDQTPLPITVVTKDATDYKITNITDPKLQINLVQP